MKRMMIAVAVLFIGQHAYASESSLDSKEFTISGSIQEKFFKLLENDDFASSIRLYTAEYPQLLKVVDDALNTPLHIAVARRCPNIVKALLKGGADTNAVNQNQNTPFDIAIYYATFNSEELDLVDEFIEEVKFRSLFHNRRSIEVLKAILDHDPNLGSLKNIDSTKNPFTASIGLTSFGDQKQNLRKEAFVVEVIKCLLAHKIDSTILDSLLVVVSEKNYADATKLLLANGARCTGDACFKLEESMNILSLTGELPQGWK